MTSLFSPIRLFQGIVPNLGSVSSHSSGSGYQVSQPSPSRIAHDSNRSNLTHVRTRSEASRGHSRQSSAVEIDLSAADGDTELPSPDESSTSHANNSNSQSNQLEFLGTISWLEKAAPFVLLLLSRIMWDHRLGILVFIGLFGTFFHTNSALKRQIALKENRLNGVSLSILLFLLVNIFFIYYAFKFQQLENCLIWKSPIFFHIEVWTVFWCVGITDFVIRFITMAIKCLLVMLPAWLINFKKRGKYFLVIENVSQFYRMTIPIPQWYGYFTSYGDGGEYFAVLSTCVYILLKMHMLFMKIKEVQTSVICLWQDTRYGKLLKKGQLPDDTTHCPICQEEMVEPLQLNACNHIFCEVCIIMWFDRERTCPMCRAKIADDPLWRDGNTQLAVQLF